MELCDELQGPVALHTFIGRMRRVDNRLENSWQDRKPSLWLYRLRYPGRWLIIKTFLNKYADYGPDLVVSRDGITRAKRMALSEAKRNWLRPKEEVFWSKKIHEAQS
jgi:hypothetical protein